MDLIESQVRLMAKHRMTALILRAEQMKIPESDLISAIHATALRIGADGVFKVNDGMIEAVWGRKAPRPGTLMRRIYDIIEEVKKTGDTVEMELFGKTSANIHAVVFKLKDVYKVSGFCFSVKASTLTISPEKKQ